MKSDLTPAEIAQVIAEELPALLQRAAEEDVITIESATLRAIASDRQLVVDGWTAEIEGRNQQNTLATNLWAALKAISGVRPANWDDDEDAEALAAWRAVDAALAGETPTLAQAFVDEIHHWRSNAAASIQAQMAWITKLHGENPALAADLRFHFLRQTVGVLEDALAGETTLKCEACGKPLRNGHLVVMYDDVGEVHANCETPTAGLADGSGPPAYEWADHFTDEEIARRAADGHAYLVAADREEGGAPAQAATQEGETANG